MDHSVSNYLGLLLGLTSILLAAPGHTAFGGRPPLDPTTPLPRELAPYDLVKLNYLGMNYCENLVDARINITSYSHLGYDTITDDAWHLQFPDDTARLVESIAWEAEFSPVARVELARRLTKGLVAAHYDGTQAYHAFRHRSGGKTYLIFDDEGGEKQGRLTLSTWGDSIEGGLKVGFRAEQAGQWFEIGEFGRSDEPAQAGNPGIARSARYWHASPYTFQRHYSRDGLAVDFTGRYWLSDEDKPLEYSFTSTEADTVQIVVGEPERGMDFFSDPNAPAILHLPDRKTTYRSEVEGLVSLASPDFSYVILRKQSAWAQPGYSTALLVMWEGQPDLLEALPEFGYRQLRLTFNRTAGQAGGRIWLYPFPGISERDMEYVYRSAEHFLSKGTLLTGGFPSQQMVNALPAGLAAGAYMLAKYGDPYAPTARCYAQNAVDELFRMDDEGAWLARAFFMVKAAAWMVKLGDTLGDAMLKQHYTDLLDRAMSRMCAGAVGYDGRCWPGGWSHFNSTKAAWLAWDATGNQDYYDIWQRALTVYTIDEQGIYRDGHKLEAPGGFDTYSGSLPLGVWGNAGLLDNVSKLINLDVPNGWHGPQTVKETWNDCGAGPWAQDDANPEYLGISLRGAERARTTQQVIPVGAFPRYEADGSVELTWQPIMNNPCFRPGTDPVRQVDSQKPKVAHKVKELRFLPSSPLEATHLVRAQGRLEGSKRVCAGQDRPLMWRFDTSKAQGAAFDLRITGTGYKLEVSPDARRWYGALDTWSAEPRNQSIDLAWLTGSRDQLHKLLKVYPYEDANYLAQPEGSVLEADGTRRVAQDGSFTYKLKLPQVVEANLELVVANGYRIECSPDGQTWTEVLSAHDQPVREGYALEDARWLQFVNVTGQLGADGTLFVRFSDLGETEHYGGKLALLQRLAVYGVFDSEEVFVRLYNVNPMPESRFELEDVIFRYWEY